MSVSVPVALGSRSYDIHIGAGLLGDAGRLIAAQFPNARRVPVVTDGNVAKLHYPALEASLKAAGITPSPIVLPPGEQTKDFAHLERVVDTVLNSGVDRGGLIVAFGGGVIGDLAGFAAGIVKRGIAFAQIPTTLLAQVDSSVGGKTAIDTRHGKNLVGVFHQPSIVVADTAVLGTLPRRELLSGYAEVAKYGLLGDAKFFAWLENNGPAALAGDQAALQQAVAHCCTMKAGIVARDERETGERALLNLGHTFGHALEGAAGFSGDLIHGEAVAMGCVLAFELSALLGLCPAEDIGRVETHFARAGMKTRLGQLPRKPSADELLSFMRQDKKAEAGRMTFILAKGIGSAFIAKDVPETQVRAVLTDG